MPHPDKPELSMTENFSPPPSNVRKGVWQYAPTGGKGM